MLIEHRGNVPEVHPSAYVAPTAVICGAVRIGGVVQVNTVLPPGATVPIGWVAVGDPAQIYPPGQQERIWAIQESLDFPGTVHGVSRETPATERMSRQSAWFAAHLSDRIIDQSPLDQSPLDQSPLDQSPHEQNG